MQNFCWCPIFKCVKIRSKWSRFNFRAFISLNFLDQGYINNFIQVLPNLKSCMKPCTCTWVWNYILHIHVHVGQYTCRPGIWCRPCILHKGQVYQMPGLCRASGIPVCIQRYQNNKMQWQLHRQRYMYAYKVQCKYLLKLLRRSRESVSDGWT